jgi:hypothetical protein
MLLRLFSPRRKPVLFYRRFFAVLGFRSLLYCSTYRVHTVGVIVRAVGALDNSILELSSVLIRSAGFPFLSRRRRARQGGCRAGTARSAGFEPAGGSEADPQEAARSFARAGLSVRAGCHRATCPQRARTHKGVHIQGKTLTTGAGAAVARKAAPGRLLHRLRHQRAGSSSAPPSGVLQR